METEPEPKSDGQNYRGSSSSSLSLPRFGDENTSDFLGNENLSESESDGKRQKVTLDAIANQHPNPNQNDNTSKPEPEPEFYGKEHALENDVILRNLFENCMVAQDLLDCRLVSRQWNYNSKPLLKKSAICISLDYDSRRRAYTKQNDRTKTLDQLNEILSKATDFPLVNFSFTSGDLGSAEAEEFFTSHGDKIKLLMLDLNNWQRDLHDNDSYRFAKPAQVPHTRIHTLRKILTEHTKNTERLVLFSIPKEWEEDFSLELFPEPRNTIQLPQITMLDLQKSNFVTEKSCRLVQDIIQAAVNLQEIRGYKIDFFDPHATAFENKIHAVWKILYNPKVKRDLDLYSKFVEKAPKLEVLKISLDILENPGLHVTTRKRIVKILQLILESSEESLVKISGFLPIPLVPNFKLPRMENVSQVECTDYRADDDEPIKKFKEKESVLLFNFQSTMINPPLDLDLNFDLAQSFPYLHRIIFEFDSSRDFETCLACFNSVLKNQKSLESVKSLKFSYGDFSPYRFVEKIAALFPAVEDFEIDTCVSHVQETMPMIWKGFPNLEKLKVSIVQRYQDAEIITENFDAAICGFSPETCVQLRNNSKNVTFEQVEALRESPSIFDVKKLSELIINLTLSSSKLDQLVNPPFFSKTTGIFGFDLARKKHGAKIYVEKQSEVAFGEIAPYVDGFADRYGEPHPFEQLVD